MTRVLTAVSGGVDSGVSASLLLERGFEVSGLFMRHRYQRRASEEESREALARWGASARFRAWTLTSTDVDSLVELPMNVDSLPFALPVDAASALELCATLGIELNLLDVDVPFAAIVENFATSYYAAQTPNPCAFCNRLIKFGLLWDVARRWGAERLATGHYVRALRVGAWLDEIEATEPDVFDQIPEWLKTFPDDVFIARSPSPKDQSYFLYGIRHDVLQNVVFPVGELDKNEVRRIAAAKGLNVSQRKDSQEICFVPDQDRLRFMRDLRAEIPKLRESVPEDTSGDFIDLDGKTIGRHEGYEKYTVGQRKGLGMGFGERIFVQKIDPVARAVALGPYDALAVEEIRAVDANWHARVPFDEAFRCEVKIRYRNESTPATARATADGRVVARLDKPCFGVAPGQALVCYWRDRLLGGGRIL